MNSKFTQKLILFLTLSTLQITLTFGQTSITLVPPDCYPGVTPSQQDATATSSNGASPFATWQGAYDYAIANSITQINFAPGTYYPGGTSGTSSQWGDSNGGFDLVNGMSVNGNGAVIDNSENDNATAFATIASNNASLNGFTFIQFTGNSAGAVRVNSGISGWSINDCNFDGCDWAGDGLSILGGTGSINNCNFYNHTRITGSALTISAGNITLNNSVFSCNSRSVAGGAVRILGGSVTYNSCTFDGNNTNSANGGAISIESGSVIMNGTKFTCNMANVNTSDDGGAINLIGNANLTLSGCTFHGNVAKDKGGAIHASGNAAVLTISNTTFTNNQTNTSPAFAGAIYLYNTTTILDGNYFSNNTATTNGGAVFVAKNQSGNGATYSMSNNTMTSNTAGNNSCTGRDVFTEMHVSGSNNNLDALADGHNLSNGAGSLQFTNGDDCDNISNWIKVGAGTMSSSSGYLTLAGTAYAYQQENTMTGGLYYWTFNTHRVNTLSGDRYAIVLASPSSDFAAGSQNGYALVRRRINSTNMPWDFYKIGSGGLDNILTTGTLLYSFDNAAWTYSAMKVKYDNGTWTFWMVTSSTVTDFDADTRGYNYCGTSVTISGETISGQYTGVYWTTDDGASVRFNNYYFRAGDETTGTGGSGSLLSAVCAGCPNSPSSSAQCPATNVGSIQGDAFRDLNNDGIMNAGEPLANVPVQLLDGNGNVVATTTTNSFGHYIFTGLATGTYQVSFGIPSGYSSATTTSQNNGAPAFDSDVAVGTGTTFLSPVINLSTSSGMSNGNDAFTGAANYYNVTAGYSTLVLPVTWSSITVKNDKCQNIVTWTTESETNNDYFVVERSKDGKIYGDAAMIDGQGDKRSTTHYEHKDASASRGVTYYRIKQVDFDGRFTYSPVVKVRNTSCAEKSFVTAYPNPGTDNNVTLEIPEVAAGEDITIIMYNHVGQAVKTYKINASENTQSLTLDITDLKSGIYMFHVSSSGGSLDNANIKFVKI
jgi:predicted outer membrane repeat protein